MNVMVIDCEFDQPSGELIEIGAAVFKAHTGELIETFQVFVKTKDGSVSPYITELTGITSKDLENGVSPQDAYALLKDFHRKHRCFMNPIVWGSGTRNDSSTIHEQSGTDEMNFMGFRVIDAKTLWQSRQMILNGRVAGGLKTCCENLGIKFDGRAHRALDDAINTFKVWHKLSSYFKN